MWELETSKENTVSKYNHTFTVYIMYACAPKELVHAVTITVSS